MSRCLMQRFDTWEDFRTEHYFYELWIERGNEKKNYLIKKNRNGVLELDYESFEDAKKEFHRLISGWS